MTALPHSCVNCLEIWEPQILEPSGPVQTCTSISSHGVVKAEVKRPPGIHGYRYENNIKMDLNK